MSVATRLFLSSMTFGIVVAIVYGIWSKFEHTGTVLLGLFAAGFLFVAGYIIVAEREARLSADLPDATPAEARGEALGVFTTASPWPICVALTTTLTLYGVIFSAWLGVLAFVAFVAAVWGWIRESR